MKVSYNQNTPSFKSRFEFVSLEKFLELRQIKNAVDVKYSSFGNYKSIINGGVIFTEGIGSCTAYGLTMKNKKEAMLGHYNRCATEVLNFIKCFVPNGRAFSVGGDIYCMSEFFERDIQDFREAKMPTTIFWGQCDNYSNVLFDADKDICYIFAKTEDVRNEKNNYDIKFVDSLKKLKNAYNIIHVAKGDELYIKGKRISSKIANQNDEAYTW